MIKGYKIRIFPTKEQKHIIWNHIGACRFIWNMMLDMQEERYSNGERHLSAYDMNRMITPIKNGDEYGWLKDIATSSLQQVCASLGKSYDNFFNKKGGHPKYKSRKRSMLSYPSRAERFYFVDDRYLQMEKLGRMRFKSDFEFPKGNMNKFSNLKVSYCNGKYMISFGMECESQARKLNGGRIGIDLGIKELAVIAYNDEEFVFHNINKSKKVREIKRKIKHTHRVISRKYNAIYKRTGAYKKTNNIIKEENKLRKLYARVSNIRHNYINHVTSFVINKLPDTIVIEDLAVQSLMKNRHLSKAIAEQNFSEFARQIMYKCEWNGIECIKADRYFPSSKTCSCCGNIKRDLKLKDRTYVCVECGFVIDRDYNAAINLMRYGVQSGRASA